MEQSFEEPKFENLESKIKRFSFHESSPLLAKLAPLACRIGEICQGVP